VDGLSAAGGEYVPIEVNERGWRWSEVLGAWLGVSELPYQGWRYRWLRLYDVEGRLVPTGEELAQVRSSWRRRSVVARSRSVVVRSRSAVARSKRSAVRSGNAVAPSRNAACARKPSDASPNWKRNSNDCAASEAA
jgi:hypothetical protein